MESPRHSTVVHALLALVVPAHIQQLEQTAVAPPSHSELVHTAVVPLSRQQLVHTAMESVSGALTSHNLCTQLWHPPSEHHHIHTMHPTHCAQHARSGILRLCLIGLATTTKDSKQTTITNARSAHYPPNWRIFRGQQDKYMPPALAISLDSSYTGRYYFLGFDLAPPFLPAAAAPCSSSSSSD
jgi:hypothetical protein